jgi:ELWxxDGT repeat protein
MNGLLYFRANTPGTGNELWRTDGSTVTPLEDMVSGPGGSDLGQLKAVSGTLYFSATDGTSGVELWKTDGQPGSATLVKDIVPGSDHAYPSSIVSVGPVVYFLVNGRLYKTDGTEPNTEQVSDVLISDPLTAYDGQVYFSGFDGVGYELWRSDGTTTEKFVALAPPNGSYPSNLFVANGALYFYAQAGGLRMFRTLGDPSDVAPVTPPDSFPTGGLAVGPYVYFTAQDATHGVELWKTKGTLATSSMVKDIQTGGNGVTTSPWMANVNGVLYFAGNDGSHGTELWLSDGTAKNTFMVQDYNVFGDTDPNQIMNIGKRIVFTGQDFSAGNELLGLTAPRPSTLTTKVGKTKLKIKASGKLSPAHRGALIAVTLYKKKGGKFRKVATKRPLTSATSAFVTRFNRPSARRCKITARFAGHPDHLPSQKSVLFRC